MKKNIRLLVFFLLVTTGYWGLSNTVLAWPVENGIAICTAAGAQKTPQLISNQQGGAIITWQDDRNGTTDIYAQAVDSNGTLYWKQGDISISTASGYQMDPRMISDGEGGAIITWWDMGNGDSKVYAQAVDSTGMVRWKPDGITICTSTGNQSNPQIISDGHGGAIITWDDSRNGLRDIYAQAIDSSGAIKWSLDGVAICTTSGNQESPRIISNGAGGGIIIWYDSRKNGKRKLYAQAIDSSGTVKWISDGVAICTTTSDNNNIGDMQIISDEEGGAVIVWGIYDIFAQAIDSCGTIKCSLDGLAICTAFEWQSNPQLITDGLGGAIITWWDANNFKVWVQAIDNNGTLKWTPGGVAISTTGCLYPQIVSDGKGGAIIVLRKNEFGGNGDIYAQAIDSTGNIKWTLNGVSICTVLGDQESPQLVFNGNDEAIVVWRDYRNAQDDIYAQSFNKDGLVPIELSRFEVYCGE